MDSILSHFGALDDLIQVIYQGVERFVILSAVTEFSWTIYVGLKGPEGRWWRGSWSAGEITEFIGSKSNPKILEKFAHNLSEAFVHGELCIGGWDPVQDATINLTFRPTSTKPVQVPLVELSAREAASLATTILSGIALQAQSRKCQLNPPAFSTHTLATAEPSRTQSDPPPKTARVAESAVQPRVEDETKVTQRRIKTLEAELKHVKAAKAGQAKSKSPPNEVESKSALPARRPKGASLANPHKKARKYEAVEFESDND